MRCTRTKQRVHKFTDLTPLTLFGVIFNISSKVLCSGKYLFVDILRYMFADQNHITYSEEYTFH